MGFEIRAAMRGDGVWFRGVLVDDGFSAWISWSVCSGMSKGEGRITSLYAKGLA